MNRLKGAPIGIASLVAEACFPGGPYRKHLTSIPYDVSNARVQSDLYTYRNVGTLVSCLQGIFFSNWMEVVKRAAEFDEASAAFLAFLEILLDDGSDGS